MYMYTIIIQKLVIPQNNKGKIKNLYNVDIDTNNMILYVHALIQHSKMKYFIKFCSIQYLHLIYLCTLFSRYMWSHLTKTLTFSKRYFNYMHVSI